MAKEMKKTEESQEPKAKTKTAPGAQKPRKPATSARVAKKKAKPKRKPKGKKKAGKRPITGQTGPKGVDWTKIKELYVTSTPFVSYAELAQDYKLALTTVKTQGKKENWVGARVAFFKEADRVFMDAAVNEIAAVKKEDLRILRTAQAFVLKLMQARAIKPPSLRDLVAVMREKRAILEGVDATIRVEVGEDTTKRVGELFEKALKAKGGITRQDLRDLVGGSEEGS